jgi:hypothetical protein
MATDVTSDGGGPDGGVGCCSSGAESGGGSFGVVKDKYRLLSTSYKKENRSDLVSLRVI